MKYVNHLLCGLVVGILQYFMQTAFSYLLVLMQSPMLTTCCFLVSCGLIAFVAGWNIFYRVNSFLIMLLRILASIGGELLVWHICVDFDVVVALENRLGFGNGSQNSQGLILVALLGWRLLVGVVMILIKASSMRNNENT